jgi:hypothetical protein
LLPDMLQGGALLFTRRRQSLRRAGMCRDAQIGRLYGRAESPIIISAEQRPMSST